jgi:hypothetical protein
MKSKNEINTSEVESFLDYVESTKKHRINGYIDLFVRVKIDGMPIINLVNYLLKVDPDLANGKSNKSFAGRVYAFAKSKAVLKAVEKKIGEENE